MSAEFEFVMPNPIKRFKGSPLVIADAGNRIPLLADDFIPLRMPKKPFTLTRPKYDIDPAKHAVEISMPDSRRFGFAELNLSDKGSPNPFLLSQKTSVIRIEPYGESPKTTNTSRIDELREKLGITRNFGLSNQPDNWKITIETIDRLTETDEKVFKNGIGLLSTRAIDKILGQNK